MAGQTFGVEVHHVREILDLQKIMRLPNSAHDCVGVIDTRGESVPVIDLAGRLARAEDGGRSPAPRTGRRNPHYRLRSRPRGGWAAPVRRWVTCLVDRVLDVIRIAAAEIETAPKTAFETFAATGVARPCPARGRSRRTAGRSTQIFADARGAPGPGASHERPALPGQRGAPRSPPLAPPRGDAHGALSRVSLAIAQRMARWRSDPGKTDFLVARLARAASRRCGLADFADLSRGSQGRTARDEIAHASSRR